MLTSRPAILLCAAAIALICSACTASLPQSAQSDHSQPEVSASVADPSSVRDPDPIAPEEPAVPALSPTVDKPESTVPATPEGPPIPKAEPTQEQEQAPLQVPEQLPEPVPPIPLSSYDFSQPVPEQSPVENDYFADAAFLGDSRSEGFYLYGVKRGKNLSASGLSVFNLDQKKCFSLDGRKQTALEVLSAGEYTKVYLGFGVNELGYINTNAFYQSYCQTIDAVRACQPQAVIYAQTIAPVNEGRVAATGGEKHLNNDRVRLYNDLIRKAAVEKSVPLLDVYTLFAVDGSLPAEASRDGVHLSGDYCRKQLEYLKTHAVSFDTLYTQPNAESEVFPNETPNIPASDPVPDPDFGGLFPQGEENTILPHIDQPAFSV